MGDVAPAGLADPGAQLRLCRPVLDRLIQVVVGGRVRADRLRHQRQHAVVVEAVQAREQRRRRMRELADYEASARLCDPQHLGERLLGLDDVAQAERDRHGVELGVVEGQLGGVCLNKGQVRDAGVPALALGDHARREVGRDHLGPAARERDARGPGAGGEIEDPLARSRCDRAGRRDAPELIVAEAEHRVRAVVMRRDLVEHARDPRGVLAQIGAVGHRVGRGVRVVAHPLIVGGPRRPILPGVSGGCARVRHAPAARLVRAPLSAACPAAPRRARGGARSSCTRRSSTDRGERASLGW